MYGSQPLQLDDAMSCILFPSIDDTRKRADWYQTRGAQFRVRSMDETSLHLVYDCPLELYTYDRSRTKTEDHSALSFPSVQTELVRRGRRLLIDCGKLACQKEAQMRFKSFEQTLLPGLRSLIFMSHQTAQLKGEQCLLSPSWLTAALNSFGPFPWLLP